MQPNDKLFATKTKLSITEIETCKAKKIATEEKDLLGKIWENLTVVEKYDRRHGSWRKLEKNFRMTQEMFYQLWNW